MTILPLFRAKSYWLLISIFPAAPVLLLISNGQRLIWATTDKVNYWSASLVISRLHYAARRHEYIWATYMGFSPAFRHLRTIFDYATCYLSAPGASPRWRTETFFPDYMPSGWAFCCLIFDYAFALWLRTRHLGLAVNPAPLHIFATMKIRWAAHCPFCSRAAYLR